MSLPSRSPPSEAKEEQRASVNLGKPSLRQRLEAYYSLVSPDILADPAAWRTKFDLIYEKFGGSHEKERRLAAKLAKKYGSTVKLLLANDSRKEAPNDTNEQHDEEWYRLRPNQVNSGVLDFSSENFDPVAALAAPEQDVARENPWIEPGGGPLLDHIDQFRSQLPECDPLRRLSTRRKQTTSQQQSLKRPKQLPAFWQIAADLETGPFSILYTAFSQRHRIRVVIRYVNGIRGTLTGYLLAFDKHFNLILRDVDEVYSPRCVVDGQDNVEREVKRRRVAINADTTKQQWTVRQRHMKQLMVRGDNVVMVYKAESERSIWPRTSKSPTASMYVSSGEALSPELRVGTPGSLIYASQRRQQR